MMAAGGGGGNFALSNRTIIDSDASNAASLIQFNTDGTIDGPGGQLGSGEWWDREPIATIGNSKYVRCASISAGTFSTSAASVGTWVELSSNRQWSRLSSSGTQIVTAVFELSRDGVTADESATITLEAEVTP